MASMLVKAVGVLMMLDGVISAAAVLPLVDTLAYRSLRDQTLFVAHLLIGALLLLSGRQVLSTKTTSGVVSEKRHPMSFFAASTLVAALGMAAVETTRFDWPGLVLRAGYTVFALAVLYRTTLPKT